MPDIETLFETPWVGVYRIGIWDFVRRPQAPLAVGILAVTPENEIVLVEQFRVPIQKRSIEIPAGIVGDEPEHLGESLAETAGRELLEETGYRAGNIRLLIAAPTTPGMSSEFMHIFHATDLVREHPGGGTEGEDIIVHHVPVAEIREWLAARLQEDCAIDARLHGALWLAGIN